MTSQVSHGPNRDNEIEGDENQTLSSLEVENLIQRLAETEAALHAVIDGQIDAVVDPAQNTPLLLQKAQEALHRSEERYHRLIDRMSAVIFELEPDGSIIEVNDAVETISGYKPDELIHSNWWKVLFSVEQYIQVKALVKEMQTRDVSNYEIELTQKSGRIINLELTSANHYGPTGELKRIVGFGVDISQRKRAEMDVWKNEKQLARAEELAEMGSWTWDIHTNDLTWSDAYYRIHGVEKGKYIPTHEKFLEFVHPQDRQKVESKIQAVLIDPQPFEYEFRIVRPDGEIRLLLARGEIVADRKGRPFQVIGIGQDITEQKKAEAELQKAKQELEKRVDERTAELTHANQRLHAVLQSLPVGVWIANSSGRIIERNEMANQIWGGEVPLAQNIAEYGQYEAWWADSGEPIEAEAWGLARAILNGESSVGEVIDIQRFDGTIGTIINSSVPMYDETGKLSGAVVASLDITHQRELEREVESAAVEAQRRAEELDAVFNAMEDAVIVFDAQGVLRTVNPAALASYGFDPTNMHYQELVKDIELCYLDGRPVPLEKLPAIRALHGEAVPGARYVLNTSKGEERIIIDSASPLYSLDGKLFGAVVVWTDITQREKLIIEIERERDKLLTLIESISDEVWFCDADGNLVLANKAVAQNLGLENVEELLGAVKDVLSKVEVYDSQGQPLEEKDPPLLRSLNGEIIVGLEEFVRNNRTGELRYRSVNSTPLKAETGEILGSVAVVRDITERKRAQDALQRAHDDLEQRVKERTQELARTNQELRTEIAEREQIEKTLRESEERYRLVIEGVKEYAIFTLDPQGYITSWNKGAENIKGYTADEIIGKHFSIFFPQEEIDQGTPHRLLKQAIRDGRYELEDWRVRKDGTKFWANIVLTALYDETGDLRGFSKVLRDMTRRKEADEALQRQTSFVKLLQLVAVAANQASTIEEAMQFALDRICEYTGWSVGFAYSVDPSNEDQLVSFGLSHLDDPERWDAFETASKASRLLDEDDLPKKVLSTKSPVWAVNLKQFVGSERIRLAADSGLKSGIAFPVLAGQNVVGVLEFFGQESGRPDHSLMEVLAHIGTQLGRVVERKRSENALRHSEARFRTIFEGAGMGIELVDLDGHLLAWNPVLAEMLGYADEELTTEGLTQIYHPANVVAAGPDHRLFEEMRTGRRDFYRLEKQFKRKDGQMLWARLSVSLVRDIDEKPQFAIGMLENITERKRMEAELSELQHRLMEGRESERIQLAQELHDGPMQDLYGLSFHLKAFESGLPDSVDTGQMSDMQGNLQQVVRTLRSICGELRPPALAPFGLEKAIRSHADIFQEANPELTIGLDLMPDGQALSEPVRLTLFRIYQQALTNVVRHANARHVMVRFMINEDKAVLEVQDDGKGFELPSRWINIARQGHLGLAGALERAESIGAELIIESAPGEGTLLRVVLPGDQFIQDNYSDENLN